MCIIIIDKNLNTYQKKLICLINTVDLVTWWRHKGITWCFDSTQDLILNASYTFLVVLCWLFLFFFIWTEIEINNDTIFTLLCILRNSINSKIRFTHAMSRNPTLGPSPLISFFRRKNWQSCEKYLSRLSFIFFSTGFSAPQFPRKPIAVLSIRETIGMESDRILVPLTNIFLCWGCWSSDFIFRIHLIT